MTMTFDGLGRFHLGFVDPRDNKGYDFMFGKEDTAHLYRFLRGNIDQFLDDFTKWPLQEREPQSLLPHQPQTLRKTQEP